MATNYVQRGIIVKYANKTVDLVPSGGVVVMDDMVGVALEDIPAGKSGDVQIAEVFRLPKEATALVLGNKVYWHTANKKIVKASEAGVVYAGRVIEDAGTAAGTVLVKINV